MLALLGHVLTLADILKERGEILKGNLPEYHGLDQLDDAVTAKRADEGTSSTGSGERRVRGRSSRGKRRGREGNRPLDDADDSSDG